MTVLKKRNWLNVQRHFQKEIDLKIDREVRDYETVVVARGTPTKFNKKGSMSMTTVGN